MGCFGIFFIGLMTSMVATGIWFTGSEVGLINQLAGFGVVQVSTFGGWGIAKNILTWFSALSTLLGWTYPYLDNAIGWIIKGTILYPVTIGVVWGIIELGQSAIQGIAGTIRSLIGG